jgi:SanA protein
MIAVMSGGAWVRAGGWLAEVLLAMVVVAWLAPNAWIARTARGRVFTAAAETPARTFAIVPGSRVHGGRPLLLLQDRLQSALALYQGGRVKAVLVSGNDSPAAPEARVMRAWLLDHGVSDSDIWTDGGGSRTRETMVRAVARYGVEGAVVCTQSVNAVRSIYLARAAGIDAVALASPTKLEQSPRYRAVESLKTALAFAESALRAAPARPATVLAAR